MNIDFINGVDTTPTNPGPASMPSDYMVQMPTATDAQMPTMTGTANLISTPQQASLTPTSLLKPMPSIINPAPTDMNPDCNTFTQWIADNPFLAGALLLGIGIMAGAFSRKGGK